MTEFNSWYLNKDGNASQSECNKHVGLSDLVFLNSCGRAYHAGFGYHLNEQYIEEHHALHIGALLFPEMIELDDEDEDNFDNREECGVLLKTDIIERHSKRRQLTHRTITVRLNNKGVSSWDSKPEPVRRTVFDNHNVVKQALHWYDLPVRKHKCRAGPFVEPLSSRDYIKVIHPYEEIVIDSTKKLSPITADDVFFASRGLCCGPDRSVESYSVISDDGCSLVLKAEIDNWST